MKFIAQSNITELLRALAAQAEVWAPRGLRGSGGAVMFERWRDDDQLDLEHFTSLSAKDLILPRTEKLFGFSYVFGGAPTGDASGSAPTGCLPGGRETIEIESAEPAPRTVLFGSRACDAKALTVLDALFNPPEGEAYGDPQYVGRRSTLSVITVACTTCDAACFCSSFENGTAEKAGSDLLLYPVEGGFLAEAVTDKGREIMSASGAGSGLVLFEESDQQLPKLAVTTIIDGLEGLEKQLPVIFEDLDFWQAITANCTSCGFCTYSCPTCHCFDIHDEMRGDREGERLRSWDACMFYLYTQETSGHNPRPTLAHRYRNRINHKFSYYPANQGKILCTGCGRCIRGCPVGLDIRAVLKAAADRAAADGKASDQAPGVNVNENDGQ